MSSFFSFTALDRIGNSNSLIKLNKLLDWSRIEKKLIGIHKNDKDAIAGQKPYDHIKMFKALLLSQWHSLSDPALEESLRVRLDFMVFTGFEFCEDIPDETTICRFRNKLIEKGLDKKLFEEINSQLENLGLKIKNANGAVVDATIVESSARPNRQIEIQEDRNEESSFNTQIIESKDPDGRWLKKGSKSFYGYKGFIAVDVDKGFIDKIHVTSANVAEVNQLHHIVDKYENKRIFADKGYASKGNREFLKEKKLKDGIMCKATKGKALNKWEKMKNKLISKKRYIVEQCFGTLKRKFNFNRSRYIGIIKVKAEFHFKSICFNLLKATNMIKIA
jgi:transposase, IS5 family